MDNGTSRLTVTLGVLAVIVAIGVIIVMWSV